MEKMELGTKVAAIITALVAIVVFAISVLDNQEARSRAHVDVWRKAAIQKAFHQVGDRTLTISELSDKLKSLAWDEEHDIGKNDLTENEVRVLLVELVSAGILLQRLDDTYSLRTSTELGTMIESNIKEELDKELSAIRSSLADVSTKTQRTGTKLGEMIENRIKEKEELYEELGAIRSSLATVSTKTQRITAPSDCLTVISFGEHRVAEFQCDGNFVIYRRSDRKVLWAAGTN